MALIKCNECGKEISDTARRCPNCGYNINGENKEIFKWILRIGIPALLIITGIIITLLITNNNPKEEKQDLKTADENTSISQMKKNSFADEAMVFAKAAETAYVDRSIEGTEKTMFTIDELLNEYIKSSSGTEYKGCIIIEVDRNGYIGDKTVYLTNGKYMIIDETIEDIKDDVDYAVDEYDSYFWEKNYETCDIQ